MISIQNFSDCKVVRYIPDLIEPFIAKQIQKEHNTFFVYRCSDYQSIEHLADCHKFNLKNISKYLPLLTKYWSAIDLIHFEIKEMPLFSCDKNYFDKLRELELKEKIVKDIQLYEVKLTKGIRTGILSVNTYNCMKEFEKLGKDMNLVFVLLNGNISLKYSTKKLKDSEFKIKTHYGRKGFTLDLGRNVNIGNRKE